MKNLKKVLAMLLVAIMVIGMFAACTKTPDPTEKPTDAPTQGATQGTTTEDIPDQLTLKVLCANNLQGGLDFKDRENWNVWPAFLKLCEAKNLTIEFECIEKDQYANQLKMVLAGETKDMPDVVWIGDETNMSTAMRVECVQEGLFYPIDDILKYSDGTASKWFEENPAYAARTSYVDGKLYWVGEYQTVTYYGEVVEIGHGAAKGMQVRLDWLDELGYTDIPNTIDEIEAFVLACQEADLNQSGVKDEVFLQGLKNIDGCGINVYYGVPRNMFALNLQTGKVDSPWYAEGAKDMVAKIIEWLEKGIIPEDRIGNSSGTTAYRNGNKVAAYSTYHCDNWSLTNTVVPEGKAPAVLIGTNPDLTVHPNAYMPNDSAPTMDNRSLAFTKNLNHPAAAAALLDILTSDEYFELIQWGTEGESFIYVNGNKTLINGADDYGNAASTNIMIGNAVFSFGVFSCMGNVYDLLGDENLCSVDASGRMRKQFQAAMNEWDVIYPDQPAAYYAIPTPEENEILTEKEADFLQLSGEIFVSFLTGERSLDDWDAAIDELKTAGLDDLLAVYEARAARFIEKTGITTK